MIVSLMSIIYLFENHSIAKNFVIVFLPSEFLRQWIELLCCDARGDDVWYNCHLPSVLTFSVPFEFLGRLPHPVAGLPWTACIRFDALGGRQRICSQWCYRTKLSNKFAPELHMRQLHHSLAAASRWMVKWLSLLVVRRRRHQAKWVE